MFKFRKNSVIDDLLPSYLELAHKFREKFGREMTEQERRLYELTKTWLESADEADAPSKEAKAPSSRR